jgi:hypothetical protein
MKQYFDLGIRELVQGWPALVNAAQSDFARGFEPL